MRRPPRTLVLARRRPAAAAWLGWLVLATVLAVAALGRAAGAQTTTPAPLPPKTTETGPTVPPPSGNSGGVIHPPATVDPGMTHRTPGSATFPTPVIPPPGSPGGNTGVVPK